MELSLRLRTIAAMVEKCDSVADIGTDHGYIPIFLVKNDICKRAIASDINLGPIEKAKLNISLENLSAQIACRLGGGLTTIKPEEVNCAIIAGMGGNLIRDIILEREEVFNNLDSAILQPVQNPEVLRRFIYEQGYAIVDEELCFDQNKFYEILKVKYDNKPQQKEDIFYEVGETLINKKHPLIKEYLQHKIEKNKKIYENIKDETESAEQRKSEIKLKISRLKELIECL